MTATKLCLVDDIEEPGSRGFRFRSGSELHAVFVVRHAGRLRGYVNLCPHARSPLDWVADRFLDYDKNHILCGTHGARFAIEDGACLGGPCDGRGLTPIKLQVEDGVIYWLDEVGFTRPENS